MAGIVASKYGNAQTIADQHVNETQPQWIAFSFLNAPSKIRVPDVEGSEAIAGESCGFKEVPSKVHWRVHFSSRSFGEEIEFVGE